MLPQHLSTQDVIDWMPVEDVAGLVLDIAGITAPVPVTGLSGYFHGVNPRTSQWGDLANALKEYYGGRIKKLVTLEEWVATLEKSVSTTTDVNQNPAVKLLDTYQSMARAYRAGQKHVYMDMERTTAHSPTVQNLEPVSPELMKHWCEQWGF
jgi:hypothetical protein